MKFILSILLLSFSAFGLGPTTYRLDTSSTNLAATFPSSPQLSVSNQIFSIDVNNGAGSEIEINCVSATQPTSLSTTSIFVPTTLSYSSPLVNSLLPSPFGKKCWLRSISGTISSGVIILVAWGY